MEYNSYYFFFWKYLLKRIKFVRTGTANTMNAPVQITIYNIIEMTPNASTIDSMFTEIWDAYK